MSKFHEEHRAATEAAAAQEIGDNQYTAYQHHLEAISGDCTGSPLADHLSPEVLTVVQDAIAEANGNGWVGAEDIKLLTRRSFLGEGRIAASTGGDTIRKHPLNTKTMFQVAWEGKGIPIGTLRFDYNKLAPRSTPAPASAGHRQIPELYERGLSGGEDAIVMACDDGLLRCLRADRLFQRSHGIGYGRLPDCTEVITYDTKMARKVMTPDRMSTYIDAEQDRLVAGGLARAIKPPSPPKPMPRGRALVRGALTYANKKINPR